MCLIKLDSQIIESPHGSGSQAVTADFVPAVLGFLKYRHVYAVASSLNSRSCASGSWSSGGRALRLVASSSSSSLPAKQPEPELKKQVEKTTS